ncbi:MAG: sucrase ferredoxin, partial [Halothece sp.]
MISNMKVTPELLYFDGSLPSLFMSLLDTNLNKCKFCSDVSQAVGEVPIGTAGTYDYWLVVELPPPWSELALDQNDALKPYLEQIKYLVYKKGVKLRPLAIAPDPDYSHPSYTRVLFYSRPSDLFSHYLRDEYLIPETELGNLASALLLEPEKLPNFIQYKQANDHQSDLLVCTHGNVDVACSRYGYPLYKKWREQADERISRVWRCSHFGGHRFAPTAITLPDGRYWGRLIPEALNLILDQQGDINQIKSYYRGWTGLDQWSQIAEQEIWLNHGWEWFHYLKAGEVLEADETDQKWATVQIRYAHGTDQGKYQVKIESTGSLETAAESGSPPHLARVQQYQVTEIK